MILSRGQFYCALLCLLIMLAGCSKNEAAKADAGAPADKKDEATPAVAVTLATATTQAMEETVSAQGTLAPAEGASTKVAAVTAGRLVTVLVKEGQTVQAGQVVATLDDRVSQAQERGAEAALRTSQAQVRQADLATEATRSDQEASVRTARLALTAAKTERDNAIQSARTALELARTDNARLVAGARPQEVAQAEDTLKQAKATRDRATAEVDRVVFLFEKGVVANRQVEDARTALAVAEAAVDTAQQQLTLVQEGARAEERQASLLRVRQAEEALALAKSSGDARVAQAEAALHQAEQAALQIAVKQQEAQAQRAAVAQKQADVAAARTSAGYAVLRAPISGTVTRRALNPGDQADPATPILEIADTHNLDLVASVPGTAEAALRVGMPAQITLAAGGGSEFTGQVRSIGQVDPQTNLLTVRIVVTDPERHLKAGAFATAKIVVRREPKAVVIPKAAVLSREDKTIVFVVGADNVAHEHPVITGVETDTLVEIRRGIKSGERVVRLGNFEITDGTHVTASEAETDKAPAGGAE